ncbi:MAG: type II toxin-antitoxin system RelE/ParE family toxin [Elainellaceae cyanobacterium]
MKAYDIIFQPSVEKDLRKLSRQNCDRVMQQIESLAANPFPTKVTKLTGTEGLYRIRVGDYRVIYEVSSEEKFVLEHYVRHRRDAYRKL